MMDYQKELVLYGCGYETERFLKKFPEVKIFIMTIQIYR